VQRSTGDILVSGDPRVALTVRAADCVPLLIADTRSGAVAAAHAGWRGLAAGVPRRAVDALVRRFDGHPGDLIAVAGPSIGACCYEVGVDVYRQFEEAGFGDAMGRWFLSRPRPAHDHQPLPSVTGDLRSDRWFFDGWCATCDQLKAAGVRADAIHLANMCTASHPAFCSYRRDGNRAGRMVGAIRSPGPPRHP
jgi:YfiH family protein